MSSKLMEEELRKTTSIIEEVNSMIEDANLLLIIKNTLRASVFD